jgi:hypothetical protein
MSSRAWFRSTDLWVMGPARFHCATLLCMVALYFSTTLALASVYRTADETKELMSEVGFEPTPTEVDCDLNAAP